MAHGLDCYCSNSISSARQRTEREQNSTTVPHPYTWKDFKHGKNIGAQGVEVLVGAC